MGMENGDQDVDEIWDWGVIKVLWYGTGNYIQSPRIDHDGEKYKKRMCVCVCVCVCIYIYICFHIYIYIYIYMFSYIYIYIYIYICNWVTLQ